MILPTSPRFDKITIRVKFHMKLFMDLIHYEIAVFFKEVIGSFHRTRTEIWPGRVAIQDRLSFE